MSFIPALGDQKIHISVDKDPTPTLDFGASTTVVPAANIPLFNLIIRDDLSKSLTDRRALGNFNYLQQTWDILLSETNRDSTLCEIHTALCPLVSTYAATSLIGTSLINQDLSNQDLFNQDLFNPL
jgi:hypothetical protein